MTKVIGDLFDQYTAERERNEKRASRGTMYLLDSARKHWDNMSEFRREGERSHDFVNGRQWNDKILYEGKWISEHAALIKQGYNPRTINLLNRVMKNVMGVVLKNGNEPNVYSTDGNEQAVCDVLNVLKDANNAANKVKLLWPLQFKQFYEWGAVISKLTYGYMSGSRKCDCWTENVDPRSFFCDTGTMDIRAMDCDMVGMLHTLPLDEVLANFATGKPKEAHRKHKMICDVYGKCADRRVVTGAYSEVFGNVRLKNLDFLLPKDHDMCRVIEVWTKERRDVFYVHDTADGSLTVINPDEYETFVEAENAMRIAAAMACGVSAEEIETAQRIVDDPVKATDEGLTMPIGCRLKIAEFKEERYWYFRFLTPTGEVLDEGESPFAHKSHPFVFVFYPFVNGEIKSPIGDLIDNQKNLNRNMTMWDQVQKISMKGFTAFDRNSLPDDDPDGDRLHNILAQPGGSYGFNLKPGEQIQNKVVQMSTNNTGIGLMEMIQLNASNIEDISGVNGALQGKPGYSTTSGSLYMQQAQNATGSLLDIIECYYAFLMDCAYKQCSNMMQFYDETKVMKVAGEGAWETLQAYKQTLNDDFLELDFKMLESPSSPVYRQIANDYLQAWLQMGLIDFPTMLNIGNFPFKDKLQVAIDSRNAEMAAAGGQPMPTMVPQQNINASVAGIQAANAGSGNNAYNRMAETKSVPSVNGL